MLSLQEFIARYAGQFVDFDHQYGAQCVDLAQLYNRDVVGGAPFAGNAIDIWRTYPTDSYTRVANTPANSPAPGDIVIWGGPDSSVGTTIYGHIAICISADASAFTSLDQNWPDGSPVHEQPHSYVAVVGWLHPAHVAPPTPPVGQHTPADYAAAAWIAHLGAMTQNVAVAQCVARKTAIEQWVQAHP